MLPYQSESSCCGCGACIDICPQAALSLAENEDGFLYPTCDSSKCTSCGLCQSVCKMTQPVTNSPIAVYAATEKDEVQLKKSTSGGMFAALATSVLSQNGVVFGATLDDRLEPVHISITQVSDLPRLQSSKYVQSDIGSTYREALEYLNAGRLVLFSGTPCQIVGLQAYLGEKNFDNLVTLDLICHGVPHGKFFRDYRKWLETNSGMKLVDFKFRDKAAGWGLTGKAVYSSASGEKVEEILSGDTCTYYDLFLHGEFYRESCFACPFACEHRPADITVGDFWGIDSLHPEWMLPKGKPFDPTKGISSFTINTENGQRWFDEIKDDLVYMKSTFAEAAHRNKQLTESPKRSNAQDEVRRLYRIGGYEAIHQFALKRLATEGPVKP